MRFRRDTANPCPANPCPANPCPAMPRLTKPRRIARVGTSALLGVVLLAGAAAATEVTYPPSDPRITLQVPDHWTVSSDANGLFMTSPEKNANVLVGIVAGNEKAVEAWAKDARAKLVAVGTKYDKSKPTRTLVAKGASNQLRIAPNTFTGAPTVGENFGSATSAIPPSLETPATPAAPTSVVPPYFKVVQMSGSTLNGNPVDIEIYLYRIGTGSILLFEQETGPVDERGIDIQHTLKILK